jgi:hypothetical protein
MNAMGSFRFLSMMAEQAMSIQQVDIARTRGKLNEARRVLRIQIGLAESLRKEKFPSTYPHHD